ncbi:hypothetical protein K493DRAFT_299078 [Basidiobolus meristosporus CBS 931.73]|uniref:Uncharacterized protein n=1 Tax=Basidiobolus meristosporus CBS 931.73 TaxID=1314790 RepID=A0A1Y1YPN8_9FUNG|nr:hypothetical protein K493DRAFT_299078 [Basidiobolus meristosporus CBS 931.73]|eukprot:ORX99987.1 hypothetical protein K493DRAFT_299078 [Basidiobolus meristosporus CBS 931.73]
MSGVFVIFDSDFPRSSAPILSPKVEIFPTQYAIHNAILRNIGHIAANTNENIVTEDLLEGAIQEEEQEEDEIDPTAANVWTTREVYTDSRTGEPDDGFASSKARLNIKSAENASPLDHLLFFLPLEHFRTSMQRINAYASSIGSWTVIAFAELTNQWLGAGLPNVKKVP